MGKRCFDLSLALILLLLLALPLALIALLIRLNMGAPVLFKQIRTGLHGQLFTLYKFRSMVVSTPDCTGDAERLTRLGYWLRRTSLDELPQLINVLRGELSFVGPRPLLAEYLPLYSPEQAKRHYLKPGITGLAQVNGRNALDWPSKFAFDIYYVEHQSAWLDTKILFKTLVHVLWPRYINAAGTVSAKKFAGEVRATEPQEHRDE